MSLRVDIKKRLKGFTLETSFSSGDHSTLGLLGASGSGKSMTLQCIAGLISPDEGVICANDRTLFDSAAGINLKPQARGVGYLFQNYALFPNMTVRKNVEIAYRGEPRERDAAVNALLARYELTEQAGKYPVHLSGGQQQRAALARIFAYEPAVLLLDEPFSALDTFLRENMQAELKRIIRGYAGDVVLVTHSRDEAYKIADRLVILEAGRAVAEGKTQDVFACPQTIQAARITGCKNISRIRPTGRTTFFALDWGVELDAGAEILPAYTHAGIRAHDFVPGDFMPRGERGGGDGGERGGAIGGEYGGNCFSIEIEDVIRGQFEKSVIFRVPREAGQPSGHSGQPCAAGAESPGRMWWITDRRTGGAGGAGSEAEAEAVFGVNADLDPIRSLYVAPGDIMLLRG
ncbi:MAG: ATP-binding cassette domain-containing protein [Clostridiales Family XIII bacterium]|nr:ATP-binding cassette domain-containing protein [Clostridiales Family XIII bacterium]